MNATNKDVEEYGLAHIPSSVKQSSKQLHQRQQHQNASNLNVVANSNVSRSQHPIRHQRMVESQSTEHDRADHTGYTGMRSFQTDPEFVASRRHRPIQGVTIKPAQPGNQRDPNRPRFRSSKNGQPDERFLSTYGPWAVAAFSVGLIVIAITDPFNQSMDEVTIHTPLNTINDTDGDTLPSATSAGISTSTTLLTPSAAPGEAASYSARDTQADQLVQRIVQLERQIDSYKRELMELESSNILLRDEIEALETETLQLNKELLDLELALAAANSSQLAESVEVKTVYNFVNVPIGQGVNVEEGTYGHSEMNGVVTGRNESTNTSSAAQSFSEAQDNVTDSSGIGTVNLTATGRNPTYALNPETGRLEPSLPTGADTAFQAQ